MGADFSYRWSICWITTFTLDPGFLGTFLLPRLGEPPLNVVVLADAQKLTEIWRDLQPDDVAQLRGLNRSYLVHPVTVGGAFHPKTVFLGNSNEGVLLAGSGNLGLYGMERGNEVFARFDSRVAADISALAVWRAWIAQVVEHANDPLLRARWADVLGRAPWLPATGGDSAFVTNWRRPLIEQILDGVTAPVDALWLTAPFFDSDLGALRALVARTAPRQINLFLGRDTSVNGERLQGLLHSLDAEVTIQLYEPHDYVHAKLVGVFTGDVARVLSGSANLSAPALLRAVTDGDHHNAEAGTIVEIPATRARALFVPPGHELRTATDVLLLDLRFRSDITGPVNTFTLVSAVRQEAGFVTVSAKADPGGLDLTDGSFSVPLKDGRTTERWPEQAGPALVWLVQSDEVVSNRVPLADAQALAVALNERSTSSERPVDLDELDALHPIGLLLADLHRLVLFDISEHPATKRNQDLSRENPDVDPEFWNRLTREQLAQDPRLDRYLRRTGVGPQADELSWLLEQMLARVPTPNVLRLISGGQVERGATEREGQRWTTEKRLATRAYNVLHRWSLAVGDPRVQWLAKDAAVRHFELLLAALEQVWAQGDDWIPRHRTTRLLETLLGAFVRTERAAGYLVRLPEDERVEALRAMSAGPAPGLAAALTYLALYDAPPAAAFGWQPFLVPGLELGVLLANERSEEVIASASHRRPAAGEIQERLDQFARYTDDAHWCARKAEELGFRGIRLARSGNDLYPIGVTAEGAGHVLTDPRLVSLIREVLTYRRELGLRLTAGGDVLAIAVGKPMYGLVGGDEVASSEPVTVLGLSDLEAAGHALGALLVEDERAAS